MNVNYSGQSTKQVKIQDYLERKVYFLLERLVVELLNAQPTEVVDWSMNWLDTKGRNLIQSRSTSKAAQLTQESQYSINTQTLTARLDQTKKKQLPVHLETTSEDEDDAQDLPEVLPKKKGPGRVSVSAEVYGQFNKKEHFVPRVIPKGQDQKDRIIKRLMQSFMFSALEDKERDIVVDAMEEKHFKQGDFVIKQGQDGDNLYVVDSGQLDCYKRFSKGAADTYLKTYQPGESFGELALLYNAPRAASIQAKNDAVAFALDRDTFNNIVKDAAIKKRIKYQEVLKHIDLLASMDAYETVQICDGIREKRYQAGDYVIREGEKGDIFYMVEEGNLIATKSVNKEIEPVQVYQYKAGDYFGELALLKNIPRQANVVAISEVRLVYLDQSAFKRLLGPVEDILKRNADKYEKYMNFDQ